MTLVYGSWNSQKKFQDLGGNQTHTYSMSSQGCLIRESCSYHRQIGYEKTNCDQLTCLKQKFVKDIVVICISPGWYYNFSVLIRQDIIMILQYRHKNGDVLVPFRSVETTCNHFHLPFYHIYTAVVL